MLQRATGDPLMQTAIFSSLGEGAGECFVALANDGATRNNPANLDLLRRLALLIGTKGSMDEVSQVLQWLDRNSSDQSQTNTYFLAAGLGEGLRRTGSSLSLVDPDHRLDRVYTQAFGMSVDYRLAGSIRLEAIRLLGASSYPLSNVGDWFLLLLDENQSPAVQSAAMTTVGSYSDPAIVKGLIARWSSFTPTLRKQAVAALLSRVERLNTVLDEIESGRIRPEELNSTEINLLRTDSDQSVRQRAVRLFGPLTPHRPAVLESFYPALRLPGDANNGRQLYQARCANCHRVGDNGPAFGPDLADMRVLSKERLLAAIIEPGAELHAPYLTYVIETKAGQLKPGLVPRQNSKTVILSPPGSEDIVLPRSNIQVMQPQPWSLMPEGLETGLTPKTMADILEYISSPSK
jgi:putative heme-binding domain-containing protein